MFKSAGYTTATNTRAMWHCAQLKEVAPGELMSKRQQTYSKLLLVPNNPFSPGVESSLGPASEMQFNLANFKLQNISQLTDDKGMKYPFTVQKYFEVHKLTQARISLASKRISTVSSGNEETEGFSTLTVASSLFKINPQGQDDRGRRWRQKYAAVDNKEEKGDEILDDKEGKSQCLRQDIEDVQRLENLRKTGEKIGYLRNQQKVLNESRCWLNISRREMCLVFFRAGEIMVAVYDCVGLLSLFA